MSTQQRFQGDLALGLHNFATLFLVKCPRCQQCAQVIPAPNSRREDVHPYSVKFTRLLCTHCGFIKEKKSNNCLALAIGIGGPYDWFFRTPLYLQTPCCREVLWLYNLAHLNYVEDYVRATIREDGPIWNGKLVSRLPVWMKSAKNREQVLQGIQKLRMSLA